MLFKLKILLNINSINILKLNMTNKKGFYY